MNDSLHILDVPTKEDIACLHIEGHPFGVGYFVRIPNRGLLLWLNESLSVELFALTLVEPEDYDVVTLCGRAGHLFDSESLILAGVSLV